MTIPDPAAAPDGSASNDVTRRTFVKAGVATAAASTLLTSPLAFAAADDRIRVGLVGCGGRGTGAATQALNADPGVVLVAMGDMFEDRLATSLGHLRDRGGARVDVPVSRRFTGFDAYRGVIDCDLDVVLLATPPHFRPLHLDAAVRAGKHVFCEKPMAVDGTGVRSVIASAEEARRRSLSLVSGFCWRYSLPERATFERIHGGAIGDVVSVHTTYHTGPLGKRPREDGWTDMDFQLRNWWHFRWLSGDHIVEQACHSIDKINWAMNGVMPVRATALGGRLMRTGPESGNVYDHFSVIYEYEGGQRCFHTTRQMPDCSNDNTDYIIGTRGNCYVNGWGPTHVIRGEDSWRYEGPTKNMYQVEHDELFASILRAGTPINDGTWMANSTLLAIMGRMAAYSGQTITLEQVLETSEDWTPPAYAMGDLAMPPVATPGTYKMPSTV